MADTPNYSWAYPTVNADADTWGTILNNMAIAIDASLKTVDDSVAAKLAKASNLSDLASASTARTNLGLGTAAVAAASGSGNLAAVQTATDNQVAVFSGTNGNITAGGKSVAQLLVGANNLSDVASSTTSRTNLGLGSIATHNVTISTSAPSGGSNGDIWLQYVP